jgi:4-hydroxy-2-oxoheptanedioate aldolase
MDRVQLISRLASREPTFALGVRASRTTDVVRWAKAAGYHCIWIDMEHSTIPVDTVSQLCGCALDNGLMSWVRVPERDYGIVNRVLDGGALGVIVPRIESVKEARDAVMACRFAPLGQRSQLSTLPVVSFETLHARELSERVNNATALKVLIESRAGVDAVDQIAGVEGIDILAVGCNDLCADLGRPGELSCRELLDACRHVIAAARRNGKIAVIGGMPEGEVLDSLLADGAAPFLFAGMDSDLFLSALRQRIDSSKRWYSNSSSQQHGLA